MASSSKKGNRPGAKSSQPLAARIAKAPASDISAAALQAAEVLPQVDEPSPPPPDVFAADVAETHDAPAAELEAPASLPAVAVEPPAEAPVAAEPAEAPVAETAPVDAAASVALRALAEKSLLESRAGFVRVKAAAEQASAAVEASCDAARDGMVAFNVQPIEAMKAGADAGFDLALAFASAKTLSEWVTFQSEYARKQFEAGASQAKAMTDLARKVAHDTLAPIAAQAGASVKTTD